MKALAVPFKVRGGVQTTSNYEAIVRGQIIDAVATNEGERLMNPTWGCNLRARLFDPTDSLEMSLVPGEVGRKLPNFVPRAAITRTDLAEDPIQSSLVTLNIGYQVSSYSQEANLSIPVETSGSDNTSGSDITE